jgi:hypothetical protein
MDSRRIVIAGLLALAASDCGLSAAWPSRSIDAGFWFEPVVYASSRLGEPLTAAELQTIESVARSEIGHAFRAFNLTVSDRREARYRVRVVQEVREYRMQRVAWVAGESRAMAGFGGIGAVNFSFIASAAMVYSPEQATRAELVAAIGRGVGRTAVHEFAHLLLPKAAIHNTRDRRSYEYASATREEQYAGEMRWDIARPWLLARLNR